jgi:hypothetical protein
VLSLRSDTRRSSRVCRTSSSCSVTSTTLSPTISCPPLASSSPPSEPPGASTTSLLPSGYSRVRSFRSPAFQAHWGLVRRITDQHTNHPRRRHQRKGREQGPIRRVPPGAAERPGRARRGAQGGPFPYQLVKSQKRFKQQQQTCESGSKETTKIDHAR